MLKNPPYYLNRLFSVTWIRAYLIIELVTRVTLGFYGLLYNQLHITEILPALFIGEINDLISLCYFAPLIFLFSVLFHQLARSISCEKQKRYNVLNIFTYLIALILLLLTAIAEIVFWDEFGTRFNFIAVDYLIYTHEIIGTIRESMSVPLIICSALITATVIFFAIQNYVTQQVINFNARQHILYIITLSFLSIIAFNYYDSQKFNIIDTNRYAIELGKNGLYEFFSAFRNNSLDYNKFYTTINEDRALSLVRATVIQDNQRFLNSSNIDRYTNVSQRRQNNKYNVILITVESLSAEFMAKFGNKSNITPYLDQLATEGIVFTKMYATGTRTVRGLEAITLSIPPTPGSSIIRRPNNQHLFNINSVFQDQGYITNFIFGGYSYFDNLENYFTGNNYNIIDRSSLSTKEISFSNIWGVADEDILTKALDVADQNYKAHRQFFSLILTTSNHRPYTFPKERIDLPSSSGRNAAVKYTDYAIGKFIKDAKQHPWFENTIFVIVADHCASSAGKTDLPVEKYHIPLIIYAPKLLQPMVISSLSSQIDIAPTITGLALPGYNYKTKFFGQDILHAPSNRAFISTYQLLGYMKDEHMVILSPNAPATTYKLVGNDKHKIDNLPQLVNEAVSFYQIAYKLYIDGMMKEF